MDMQHPDYLDLRSRIRENPGHFVCIAGAGLSRPCGLPSWAELRDALVEDAMARLDEQPAGEKEGYSAKIERIGEEVDLWRAFSELCSILSRQAYERVIQAKLTIGGTAHVPKTYDLLWKLRIKGIVTFNMDKCAVDSYARVHSCVVDSATSKEFARFSQFLTGTQNFVFQPHGIVSDPTSWIFRTGELKELLASPSYIAFMQSLCQSKQLLLLGFNPEDFAFQYILQKSLGPYLGRGPSHYAFLPCPAPSLIQELGDTRSDAGFCA